MRVIATAGYERKNTEVIEGEGGVLFVSQSCRDQNATYRHGDIQRALTICNGSTLSDRKFNAAFRNEYLQKRDSRVYCALE